MNYQERQKNILVLFKMAKYLEQSSEKESAEILFLEASQQADQYLNSDSQLRAKVLIGCIDFYDYLGREEESKLMRERLKVIANSVLEKLQLANHKTSSSLIDLIDSQ